MSEPEPIGSLISLVTLSERDWEKRDQKIRNRREQEEREQRQREASQERWRLAALGIPAKDIEQILSGALDDTEAIGAVRDFYRSEAQMLVLSGTRGCGKTTAAGWWLTHQFSPSLYFDTKPVRFVDVIDFARTSRYDDGAMDELKLSRALVLDDIGMEYLDDKGAFASLFSGVLNSRYNGLLPTLITTNATAQEFKERYGERIVDRLREAGRFTELSSGSLRGR